MTRKILIFTAILLLILATPVYADDPYTIVVSGGTATGKYPNGTTISSSATHTTVIEAVSVAAEPGAYVALTGAFTPTSKIDIAKSLHFYADGNATFTFDANTTMWSIVGTNTGIKNLTADAVFNDTLLQLNDVTNVLPGDIAVVYDDDAFTVDYPSWEAGESHRVVSVAGNNITITDGGLINTAGYQVAEHASIQFYRPYWVTFEGIAFTSTLTDQNTNLGVYLQRTVNSSVTNCTFSKMGTVAIGIYNSVNASAVENNIWDGQGIGYGYGVSVNDASSNVTVVKNVINHTRHCVTLGGTNYIGNTRSVYVGFNVMTGGIPVDAHGETWEYTVDSNVIQSDGGSYAIELGAKVATITNNTISSEPVEGITLRGDLNNCTWTITGNTFNGSWIGFRANSTSRDYTWDYLKFTGNSITGGGPQMTHTAPNFSVLYFETDAFPEMLPIVSFYGTKVT